LAKGKRKLLIIDGNAIIHRAYHALPPLTTKKGELVNAVYGFALVLLNVINRFKAEYIVATFDLKEPTFRHKEFKEYKATRVKAPDDLYEQIPLVKELVRAFNIPIFEKKGFEADDLIATIIKKNELLNPEIENIIVTGDLDTLQLISDKTKVLTLKKGVSESMLYDIKSLKERYGLAPEQMADYKGLRGDSSDNLPGVKGIGEKTAVELLKKYHSIEEIYKNLPAIKESIRKKLEAGKVQAFFSKKLAKLVENIPIKFNIDQCRFEDFNRVKVINLLRDLEFFSLLRRLPGYDDVVGKIPDQKEGKENSVTNDKSIRFEIKKASEIRSVKKEVSVYLGVNENGDTLDLSLSDRKNYAVVVMASDPGFDKLIRTLFEKSDLSIIGYNLKNLVKFLDKRGVSVPKISFDNKIAAYILNAGANFEWENLVLRELNIVIEKKEKKKGQAAFDFGREQTEKEIERTAKKAAINFLLKEKLTEKLEAISREQIEAGREKTIKNLFEEIEMPLIPILARMEEAGIRINKRVLNGISQKLAKKMAKLEKEIQILAGGDFNVNSSVQLREILYEKLKIPTNDIKKGKTGFSTASSELQKIRKFHPIVEKIEEYREVFKLKTTYLDPLPDLAGSDLRIHTNFNQAVTATGRLSSSDPNLQNIPTKTDLGQLIRTAFEAEPGAKLVSADYSQIELRIIAHLSGDVKMISTFLEGEDIHTATAARVNKVDLGEVTTKMRNAAKALNFGIIYGMSTYGFSQSAGVDQEEAKEFIKKYFATYPQVASYIESVKQQARKNGFVETELGRRRYIPEINSTNFQLRAQAERMAINMPVQGLAADIIKLAMIKANEIIRSYRGVKMILQIHDELIFEVAEEETEKFSQDIKTAMENVYKLSVPLVVDVKVGDNWGEI